jgi:hypothetical protein
MRSLEVADLAKCGLGRTSAKISPPLGEWANVVW